jgi:hypothetical protein
VEEYAGNEAVEAMLYSVRRRSMYVGYFAAEAEFRRPQCSAPGLVEVRIGTYGSDDQFGPVWRCRTRAAIDALLGKLMFDRNLDYVLVVRQGRVADTGGLRDRREVVVEEQKSRQRSDAFNNFGQQPPETRPFRMKPTDQYELMAAEAFPTAEDYVCFHLDKVSAQGTCGDGQAAVRTACGDLVQAFVAETELRQRITED